MRRARRSAGTAVLPAAFVTLAVAGALAAALAEVARTELALAHRRVTTATALAAVDACVADTLAALPTGWDFAALVLGADGVVGTADDGALPLPAGCTGRARGAPGAGAPPRALLALQATVAGGRRGADVVVGRDALPGVPAVLWLSAPPPAALGGRLALDGTDAGDATLPPTAALAAPLDADALDAWMAGQSAGVQTSGGTVPPITALAPPLADLRARLQAAGASGAGTLVPAPPAPPALTLVPGDLVVDRALVGAGLLFVDGVLDIQATLDFTGVVVASGGMRVTGGGRLTIAGALWAGATGPLTIDGDVALRASRAAIADVDARLTLPRRAVALGLRDSG